MTYLFEINLCPKIVSLTKLFYLIYISEHNISYWNSSPCFDHHAHKWDSLNFLQT